MSALVQAQPAYVLHTRAWRETSALVELLTRDHGRIGVVARGLHGAKRHPLRAALRPLQYLRIDYLPRGELARLVQAEAIDTAPRLSGEALLAAFYVNELVLRLTARQDPAQAVFELYARVRAELGAGVSLSWTLRRFERDLLDAIGVGLPWAFTADGERIEATSRYRLDPEHGPVRDSRRGEGYVSGEALLALAEDRMPSPEGLAELGSQSLRSWGLLAELARVGTAM
jgi:DNA repair protein RecO (recombination protein O)